MDQECRYCIHFGTYRLCGNSLSPNFQRRVAFEDSCPHFELSNAQVKCAKAQTELMTYVLDKKSSQADRHLQSIINNYSDAIAAGLPAEDEIEARVGIANAYSYIVINREMTTNNWSVIDSVESSKVTENLKIAANIDKRTNLHHITEIPYSFYNIDNFLDARGARLSQSDSRAAEQFTREHLAIFNYVLPTPLPNLMLLLGLLLLQQKNPSEAAPCFKAALDAAEDKRHMPGALEKIRQQAFKYYNICFPAISSKERIGSNERPLSKPHASSGTGCLIVTLVLISGLIGMALLLRL